MASHGRVYGGRSAADRMDERRRQLIEAGLDLIADRTAAELTIGDICAEARLTKRYFYEQFHSMDSFLDDAMNHAVERLTEAVGPGDEPDGDHGPRDRVGEYIHALVADPRIARLVLIETLGGGTLAAHRSDLVHRSVEFLMRDFMLPGQRDLDDATRAIAAFALSGATSEVLVAWIEGDLSQSIEQIVDFLSGMFAAVAANA